jgi:hypothetical protein
MNCLKYDNKNKQNMMNYGFAGTAYFGMFLCWFYFMYAVASIINDSLNSVNSHTKDDDEAVKILFFLVKVSASLVAISLTIGVVQWLIETTNK